MRDESAKHFSRFISSVNMVTCKPWYLWERGFTKLWTQERDGARIEAKGKYDELRVHLMEYQSLPDGVRNRLEVADKLAWMSHPLSGYLLKVFFDAFELGRVWGCIMLEHQRKPKHGYFYAHGYGLTPGFPDTGRIELIQESANGFWGTQKTLSVEVLGRGNPLKRPTKKPDEEGYAEAQAKYQEKIQQYAKLSEKFYEGIYIKQDFDLLLELFHELFSKDLFAHISKHWNDEA